VANLIIFISKNGEKNSLENHNFFVDFFHFQSPSCEISPQIETVQVPNQAVELRHLESKPSKPFQTALFGWLCVAKIIY
jgi:hypothetical protein